MRAFALTLATVLAFPAVAVVQPVAAAAETVPAYVTAAMNDPARSAQKDDDARRQMAAVLAFSGVKPGDSVMELLPGTGYWTRTFSQIVGSKGHVYTVWPSTSKPDSKNLVLWQGLVKTPHYSNVSVMLEPLAQPQAPVKVDLVFTDDNYHDLHNPGAKIPNMLEFNKAVYAALKPGGLFVIVDHKAPPGSGTSDTDTFHRIDPAAVRKEVEAAGFVFDGSSNALNNPKDPLNIAVFNKAIRGHTSQFIYRFRKPSH